MQSGPCERSFFTVSVYRRMNRISPPGKKHRLTCVMFMLTYSWKGRGGCCNPTSPAEPTSTTGQLCQAITNISCAGGIPPPARSPHNCCSAGSKASDDPWDAHPCCSCWSSHTSHPTRWKFCRHQSEFRAHSKYTPLRNAACLLADTAGPAVLMPALRNGEGNFVAFAIRGPG